MQHSQPHITLYRAEIYFNLCGNNERNILHPHLSRNKVIGNHFFYSQTYWMFNLKQPNIVLLQQNTDAKP